MFCFGCFFFLLSFRGAGKTSLLYILAHRVRNFTGEIIINKQSNNSKALKQFRAQSAFVQQDDILMGNLKVREALIYSAMLRLPSSMSIKERIQIVDNVLDEVGLKKAANTLIGVPGFSKGISGGERKRLSIAMELLTGPSVLFLDEPTTGLDARTALNVIQTIDKLARSGRTVVLTIHQPRSDIVSLFDKVLLLARGKVAYYGKAKGVTQYFGKLGYHCPRGYNLADFMIDLVADAPLGSPLREVSDKRILHVLDSYEKQKDSVEHPPELDPAKNYDLGRAQRYRSNWFTQFAVIFARSFISILRDRMLTMARLFQTVVMAVLVGLIFLRLGYFQSNVQDRIGAIFFILLNSIMGSMFGALLSTPADIAVFMRERGAKTYHVSSYYLGKALAELPSQILFPIMFSLIAYWMVGLNPYADRFFLFLLIIVIMSTSAQAFGVMISTVAPKAEVGLAIAPVVLTVLMMFSGFYLNISNIPVYFIWVYWISIFHFGFEALVLNELSGVTFFCKDSELKGPLRVCPIPDGQTMINNLSMTTSLSNIWINLGFMLLLQIIMRLVTFLALRFLKKPRAA